MVLIVKHCLVVSGFGLASVYIAPTTEKLLKTLGINNTFMYLGICTEDDNYR